LLLAAKLDNCVTIARASHILAVQPVTCGQ
jgi:hypothetical protein